MTSSKFLKPSFLRLSIFSILSICFLVSLSHNALAQSSNPPGDSVPCCGPVYVRKIVTARCSFPAISLVRKLVKEKVRERLIEQGCSGVQTSVRVSKNVVAREDVGLNNIVSISNVDNDPLTFRVDTVDTTCSLPVVVQVTSKFRDRFGVRGQRTHQSSVEVVGEYR